jgi:5-methyltetrahydrofolate--homocysteine methyltransferase
VLKYIMNKDLEHIKSTVVNGRHNEIEGLVKKAIQSGTDLNLIIDDALTAAMEVVGERFADGEIFIPEMLVAAITMKKGLGVIKPFLNVADVKSKGTILIGTVKGDLHDVGKNLVIIMLEADSFNVIDLGVDVSRENFVQKVKEMKPDIIGLSALLTTTMPEMKKVLDAFEENNLRNSIKVIVGGAPIDAKFAKEIGSDGYGKNAAEAVQVARNLTGLK